MKTHEKIETIVNCYQRNGTRAGAFGTCQRALSGGYLVEADGKPFIVRHGLHGWSVRDGLMVGMDRSLIEAARMALEG